MMRWLQSLDITYRKVTKRIYIDVHEREDVIEYRQKFLAILDKLDTPMPVFPAKDDTFEKKHDDVIWPAAKIQPFLLVTHDESTFFVNDGLKRLWMPDGEEPLRKKGKGRSIHVSDCLCPSSGCLALEQDKKKQFPTLPEQACVIMHAGIQHDGWWEAIDLYNQVLDREISIFEAPFPCMQALFAFHNATSHATFADDALCADRMNLSPVGKQHLMRQTTWGNGIYQELVFPEDHAIEKLRGKEMGIKVVLQERGLWRAASNRTGLLCQKKHGKSTGLSSPEMHVRRAY